MIISVMTMGTWGTIKTSKFGLFSNFAHLNCISSLHTSVWINDSCLGKVPKTEFNLSWCTGGKLMFCCLKSRIKNISVCNSFKILYTFKVTYSS